MRSIFALVLVSIAFLASTIIPSNAGVATWGQSGTWHVYGNSDTQTCGAVNYYKSGAEVGFVLKKSEFILVISKENVANDRVYTVGVDSYFGEPEKLISNRIVATTDNFSAVLFNNLSDNMILSLTKASVLEAPGVGTYSLTEPVKQS